MSSRSAPVLVFFVLLALSLLALYAAAAEGPRAFFTVDDVVRAEPAPSAAAVLRLKAGAPVVLGERRGFWRRIESETGASGWVRLSTLRVPNSRPAVGLAATDSGRDASGNVVLTSGARSVAGRGAPLTARSLRAVRIEVPVKTTASDALATERELEATIFDVARPLAMTDLQDYVNGIGTRVVRTAAMSERAAPPGGWRVVVIDSPSIISFALPGGMIVLSRGLYTLLESEDELAVVIAREMAHVQRGHHLRSLRSPAIETYLRPLEPELEFAADAQGSVWAAAAGYDAAALVTVLERIDRATGAGRDTALLRAVAPSVSDRIATLAEAATPELERASSPLRATTPIRQFRFAEK